jgi:hypothetical protein
MKKLLSGAVIALLFASLNVQAQDADKSKRPSPPATTAATLSSGALVTISYSQPSVKGRTIGKDLEPMAGQVWRTGANEATVFETNKNITVNGSALPAGKYAFFTIANGNEWTLIFNKKWNQWGAYNYKEADDALRVKTSATNGNAATEKFTITLTDAGKGQLLWGDVMVPFTLQ